MSPTENEATENVTTTVHLLRHGEVFNPEGVLYGRLPGFHLSERGQAMAQRVADVIGDRDITHVVSSPLERAQETAAPLAGARGLEPELDPRVIESTSVFEGHQFGGKNNALRKPSSWRHLWNPFRPSWGEPYSEISARMLAAMDDAREAAMGHEAVVVSHQLPIWTVRRNVEKKSMLHDPRRRQCTICSLTSFHFKGEKLVGVSYSEPAADLLPAADRSAPFSAGGAPEEKKP